MGKYKIIKTPAKDTLDSRDYYGVYEIQAPSGLLAKIGATQHLAQIKSFTTEREAIEFLKRLIERR